MRPSPDLLATPSALPQLRELVNRLASPASGDVAPGELLGAVAIAVEASGGAIARITETAVGQASQIEVVAMHPEVWDQVTETPAWLPVLTEYLSDEWVSGDAARVVPLRNPRMLEGEAPAGHAVAMPIATDNGRWCVVLCVAHGGRAAAEVCRQQLELCGGLFAWQVAQRSVVARERENPLLSAALSVLSAVGAQASFRGAAQALCDEVASRFRGSRVTFGVRRGRYVKAVAMSRSERLDRKMRLVGAIESAMEECLDQDLEVLCPAGEDAGSVSRAAKRLSAEFGPHHIVSLPLRRTSSLDAPSEAEAVLTVEAVASADPAHALAFSKESLEALRLACNLAAPLLLKLDDSDRWAGAKLSAEARRIGTWVVGPRNTLAKLLSIAGCVAFIFVCTYRGVHRVSGSFVVQAAERRVVAAPFDGYLKAVYVEPGDEVIGGETLLAELETSELRLELSQKLADRGHFIKQANLARRESKTAESQIAQAEAERVTAEIGLLEYQIEKAALLCDVSAHSGGVVLEGDRKRRVGGSVRKGEALFEVAPLEGLRAELRIPESQVAEVRERQRGELAAVAHPSHYLGFTIEKVEPLAEVLDGQNVFRAWVRLEGAPSWFRPGMEGVAKIEVGEAPLIWLWTHEAVGWVRMKLWL